MSSTKINCKNATDGIVEFTVVWALSLVGERTVKPGELGSIGAEFVWYDVFVKDSLSGKPLASKSGVYGNSTVILEKHGDGYIVI